MAAAHRYSADMEKEIAESLRPLEGAQLMLWAFTYGWTVTRVLLINEPDIVVWRWTAPTGEEHDVGGQSEQETPVLSCSLRTFMLEVQARSRVKLPPLLIALEGLLSHYVALVESSDAGKWDAETEAPVLAARAAIATAREELK